MHVLVSSSYSASINRAFFNRDGTNYLMNLPCRVFLIDAAIQLKMSEVTVTILSVIVKLKNKWHLFAFIVFSGDRH